MLIISYYGLCLSPINQTIIAMKHFYLLFILFCFIVSSQKISADSIPLKGEWSEKGLRSSFSIPFFVEKEANTLYIYSSKKIEDVTVRVKSTTGIVLYEGIYTFLPFDWICLSIDELSKENCVIELIHVNGILSGFCPLNDE